MNKLEFFYKKSSDIQNYFNYYISYLAQLSKTIDYIALDNVVNCFLVARRNSNCIFFAGNGGSATTASHFAQDLTEVGRKANVKGFKTMSLTDNISFLTAIANDYGYEKVFANQMSELFNTEDVFVAISASGNSPNVIEAAKYANQKGGKTICFVGFDGGELSKLCHHVIHVTSEKGEYGPVEDIHMILDHMITSFLTFKLMSEK